MRGDGQIKVYSASSGIKQTLELNSIKDIFIPDKGFKIHMTIEYAGIYSDYLLFRKFLPEYLKDLLLFYSEAPEKEVKDKSIEELENMLKTMVKPYLSEESIAAITDYVNKL